MKTTSVCNLISSVLLAAGTFRTTAAAGNDEWRRRSIYQVMTDRFALSDGSTTAPCDTGASVYCGGTWRGIINKLDYIQGMGFDAIWISPITAQLYGDTPEGESYHGYWQTDLYHPNAAFGSVDDLQSLAAELHARGMYLMVDVVTNHFASNGTLADIGYDNFAPFNDQKYFHTYCPVDYNNVENSTNMEQCWVGSTSTPLPDLRTEDLVVQSLFDAWITQMVAEYSIDGLRIDSVLAVNQGFWNLFMQAANVYAVGEILTGDVPFVYTFQKNLPGVMNYGTYFPMIRAFQSTSGSMSDLVEAVSAAQKAASDVTLLGTFSENHDQPRFASLTEDMTLAQNVIAFSMLTDGIPIIYQGQEQHYAGDSVPYNREALWLSGYDTSATLYGFIGKLNAARKNAMRDDSSYLTYYSRVVYSDASTIALIKGKMLIVMSNKGESGDSYSLKVSSGGSSGESFTELLTCEVLTADSNGQIIVPMAAGAPRIYYPSAGLASGNGLCT